MPHGTYSADNIIRIEKTLPTEAYAGTEFEYEVKLTNVSDFMLHDVTMREYYPDAQPQEMRAQQSASQTRFARMDNNNRNRTTMNDRNRAGLDSRNRSDFDNRNQFYTQSSSSLDRYPHQDYTVGMLSPGESETITVRTSVEEPGEFDACTAVFYTPVVCSTLMATKPELTLEKRGPSTARVGEDISYTLVVSNNGVGAARNVKITDTLPEGLQGDDGKSNFSFDVGTLEQGDSESFTVEATPTREGTFVNRANARADRGLTAQAQATTKVVQPKLEITKSGPDTEYTNVGLQFDITVRNTGSAPAHNVIVEDEMPAGLSFRSATGDGRSTGRKVSWNLGTLDVNEQRTVHVTFEGAQPGTINNCATARADGVKPVEDCELVRLEGVAALLIVLVDENDPIKIGERETYTITVTNQGNEPATNVAIDTQLDPRTTFVTMSGDAQRIRTAQGARTRAIPSLAPGEKVQWTVTVEGRSAGDSRFRVNLTADQLDRPVTVGESTRIFD